MESNVDQNGQVKPPAISIDWGKIITHPVVIGIALGVIGTLVVQHKVKNRRKMRGVSGGFNRPIKQAEPVEAEVEE